MDKRSIITTLACTLVLMGIWVLTRYAQTRYPPIVAAPSPATPTTTVPSVPGTTGTSVATTGPESNWHLVQMPAGTLSQPISLGSGLPNDKTYALQLNVNPSGAGLSSVVLNQFKNSDDFKKPEKERRLYVYQTPAQVPGSDPDAAAARESLATRKIEIDGTSVDLLTTNKNGEPSLVNWALETPEPFHQPDGSESAIYSVILSKNGTTPGLKVLKKFTVHPINTPGKGYEVGVVYELRNLSGQPLTNVKLTYNGPTLPPKEGGRGADRQALSAYLEGASESIVPHPVEEFTKDKPIQTLAPSDKGQLAWAGTCSVYFHALVLPEKTSPAGNYVDKIEARGWSYDDSTLRADERPVTLSFTTAGQKLAEHVEASTSAGTDKISLPMDVYFGPRWREVLKSPYYAAIPRHYDETLVLKTPTRIFGVETYICTICQSETLIKLMVMLLSVFHWIAGGFAGHGDWGIAIILLVGVVRLLLHPITKRSQVQMMKMGKMGPEMERLKKKYADDKDELNRQMMQFYKAQGAAPILGCLPMLLQTPIWIALYSSLQSTFELRQAPFLWNLTWIHDLSKPDYMLYFPEYAFTIPLIGMHIDGLNLLPILMGVVFYLQTKYLQPPNPAMSEDQLKQQKMMQMIMPFIFPITLYNAPSGLNLYIFASTLFGVIESKIIRKHIKEREEAEKAERVIVDAKPTRQGKRLARTGQSETAPPSGLRGFWANLQAKVEEARRDEDRRGGSGRK